MRDGPSLQKELLLCVYYTGVLSHGQLLFWDFCFEEMAMENHQVAKWKKIKTIVVTKKKLQIDGRKEFEEKVLDLKKSLEHDSKECMKEPLTHSRRI